MSTWASTRARARSRYSPEAPTAAATRSLPSSSLQALGYCIIFWMSFTVISPRRLPSSSTTRSFSILCSWRRDFASSRVVPSGTVTRFSLVMRSEIGRSRRVSNRRSRLVRIPTRWPSASVTGTPEILYSAMTSRASSIVWPGRMVTGSTIIPASDRFTRSTSRACFSMVRFLWTTPIPPSWARAMASWDSVTVSMAAEIRGMLSSIPRQRRVFRSTSAGWTSDREGTIRTSSKVRANSRSRSGISVSSPGVSARIVPGCRGRRIDRIGSGLIRVGVTGVYKEGGRAAAL